jgi:penicillin-insensitive murein endopeptidase
LRLAGRLQLSSRRKRGADAYGRPPPSTPAKELFARKSTPFPSRPRSIGGYFDGCLAGAVPLPITGPIWQVMRLSRNRNWGNPRLVRFIERFANNAKKVGWNGLLVGDMSQPRGGPMLSDHRSHQVGLDVDIWFTPMPDHVQSREEREFGLAVDVVAKDELDVDPQSSTSGSRNRRCIPPKPKPPLTLAGLPSECKQIVRAP